MNASCYLHGVVARERFVADYRGHRIVTDGKLFGVDWPPFDGYRYLSIAGARAAINSATMIAERQAHLKWREETGQSWLRPEPKKQRT